MQRLDTVRACSQSGQDRPIDITQWTLTARNTRQDRRPGRSTVPAALHSPSAHGNPCNRTLVPSTRIRITRRTRESRVRAYHNGLSRWTTCTATTILPLRDHSSSSSRSRSTTIPPLRKAHHPAAAWLHSATDMTRLRITAKVGHSTPNPASQTTPNSTSQPL